MICMSEPYSNARRRNTVPVCLLSKSVESCSGTGGVSLEFGYGIHNNLNSMAECAFLDGRFYLWCVILVCVYVMHEIEENSRSSCWAAHTHTPCVANNNINNIVIFIMKLCICLLTNHFYLPY